MVKILGTATTQNRQNNVKNFWQLCHLQSIEYTVILHKNKGRGKERNTISVYCVHIDNLASKQCAYGDSFVLMMVLLFSQNKTCSWCVMSQMK